MHVYNYFKSTIYQWNMVRYGWGPMTGIHWINWWRLKHDKWWHWRYTCVRSMVLWLDEARDWHPRKKDNGVYFDYEIPEYGPWLVLWGGRTTYDIVHNGGYLALPTWYGERRFGMVIRSANRLSYPPPLRLLLSIWHLGPMWRGYLTWILNGYVNGDTWHLVTMTRWYDT